MTFYSLFNLLLQPFTLLTLLTSTALGILWHRRRETWRRLLPVTVLGCLLLTLCLPAVAHLAMASLEWRYPSLTDRPADADVIVVLAGGAHFLDSTHRQVELGTDTLHRCAEAAALYHKGKPCPIIASGGTPYPNTPLVARYMRDFFASTCDVQPSDLIVEDRSRTTYESALEVRKLMAEHGFRKVILVTEAVHMERSLRGYQKQAIPTVPAACHHRAGEFEWSLTRFVPNPTAAEHCMLAFHEWLGLVWYRIKGRI